MSLRDARVLREMLAGAGIEFERVRAATAAPRPVKQPAAISDDERAAIREVIVAASAPEHDVEWLVASCPSVAAAQTYRAPVGVVVDRRAA